MSTLYDKSLIKLELDQILSQLAECAGSVDGKAACLQLRPISDLEDVQILLDETAAAWDLSFETGIQYMPFWLLNTEIPCFPSQ